MMMWGLISSSCRVDIVETEGDSRDDDDDVELRVLGCRLTC